MNAAFANIVFGNETLYFLEQNRPVSESKEPLVQTENKIDAKVETSNVLTEKVPVLEVAIKTEVASKPSEEKPIISENPPVVSNILPNKTKDLVVIVHTQDAELKEFLGKILTAINRNIDDIEIIDLEQLAKTNIKAVIESTNAVFSFGVPFTSLGFKADLPAYILKMAREKHYLYADDLQTIQLNANNEKRNLWSALKNILN